MRKNHRVFGGRWHGGRRWEWSGGGRRGRGDLKYEILEALIDGPRHGYDIMLGIEEKRGLRPSPGSIYPALQMLEDGDCVRGGEREGKRVYEITDKGRDLLSHREPSDDANPDHGDFVATIAEAMKQVQGIKDAARQIARNHDIELYRKAIVVLDRARRELFELLADYF